MASHDEKSHPAPFPWHLGVYDAHCHPTDTMSSIESIPRMKASVLTIMATRAQDQDLVASVADRLGFVDWDSFRSGTFEQRVIPCFGWHPWFSHQIYDDLNSETNAENSDDRSWKHAHYQNVLVPKPEDPAFLDSLPEPRALSDLISRTRTFLQRYPLALVGEIGLDKGFCLPYPWSPDESSGRDSSLTPGGREGRKLSPHHVAMSHQKKVLKAQLNLAGEMQRAVSVHGVQAHGLTYEVLHETWKGHEKKIISKRSIKRKGAAAFTTTSTEDDAEMGGMEEENAKPYPPRVCLHSYSGLADGLREYYAPSVPTDVYISFSSVINFSSQSSKAFDVIKKVPEDRLLIESDLHCAGEKMDGYLEEVARLICDIRGWSLEEGVTRLGRNWRRFVFGQEDLESSVCSSGTSSTTKIVL